MAQLTDSYYRVGMYLKNSLEASKLDLGVADVFYGDQDLLPHTPAVCIETGNTVRTLTGAPFRVDNIFQVFIMIYHGKVQDVQVNRAECDALTVAVQDYLHSDVRLDNPLYDDAVTPMDGLVIYGMVSGIEPGYSVRNKSLMRTSRITWEGKSKTSIVATV